MLSFFYELNPIIQAFIATFINFLITSFGSSCVFLFKSIKKEKMDILLSLSSGIMLASSFFSLINPSIEHAKNLNLITWIVCSMGILIGGLFLFIGDKIYQKQKKTNNIGKLILSI